MNLIEYTGSSHFKKRKSTANDIPLAVLLYCILSDNANHLEVNAQIDIDTLLEGERQIGRYMNLSYATLLELLQQLENANKLTLVNNFGNRYIHMGAINPRNVLVEYYQEIAR